MTESSLTQSLMQFCRVIMRGSKVMKHSDRFNNGYPDMTVTWRHVTSWWEVKFYDERMFESPAIQEQTCKELAQQGTCNYIIYELRKGVKRTLIVQPDKLEIWDLSKLAAPGYNHAWVASIIRLTHIGLLNEHLREDLRSDQGADAAGEDRGQEADDSGAVQRADPGVHGEPGADGD